MEYIERNTMEWKNKSCLQETNYLFPQIYYEIKVNLFC